MTDMKSTGDRGVTRVGSFPINGGCLNPFAICIGLPGLPGLRLRLAPRYWRVDPTCIWRPGVAEILQREGYQAGHL